MIPGRRQVFVFCIATHSEEAAGGKFSALPCIRKELPVAGPVDMGFSLLRTLEFFVFRKMEMSETIIHLLCGWSQIVIQKITFPLQ